MPPFRADMANPIRQSGHRSSLPATDFPFPPPQTPHVPFPVVQTPRLPNRLTNKPPRCRGAHHDTLMVSPWWNSDSHTNALWSRIGPELDKLVQAVSPTTHDGLALYVARAIDALDSDPFTVIPDDPTQEPFDLCPTCAFRWDLSVRWHSPLNNSDIFDIDVLQLFRLHDDKLFIWAHQVPPTQRASAARHAAYTRCILLGLNCNDLGFYLPAFLPHLPVDFRQWLRRGASAEAVQILKGATHRFPPGGQPQPSPQSLRGQHLDRFAALSDSDQATMTEVFDRAIGKVSPKNPHGRAHYIGPLSFPPQLLAFQFPVYRLKFHPPADPDQPIPYVDSVAEWTPEALPIWERAARPATDLTHNGTNVASLPSTASYSTLHDMIRITDPSPDSCTLVADQSEAYTWNPLAPREVLVTSVFRPGTWAAYSPSSMCFGGSWWPHDQQLLLTEYEAMLQRGWGATPLTEQQLLGIVDAIPCDPPGPEMAAVVDDSAQSSPDPLKCAVRHYHSDSLHVHAYGHPLDDLKTVPAHDFDYTGIGHRPHVPQLKAGVVLLPEAKFIRYHAGLRQFYHEFLRGVDPATFLSDPTVPALYVPRRLMRHCGRLNYALVVSSMRHFFVPVLKFICDLRRFPLTSWTQHTSQPFYPAADNSSSGIRRRLALIDVMPTDSQAWEQQDLDTPRSLNLTERKELYDWLCNFLLIWPHRSWARTYVETGRRPGLWRRPHGPAASENAIVLGLRHRQFPFTDDGIPVFAKDATKRLQAVTFGREVAIRPCSIPPGCSASTLEDVHIMLQEADAYDLAFVFAAPRMFPERPPQSPELVDHRCILLDDNTASAGAWNKGYSLTNDVLNQLTFASLELAYGLDIDPVALVTPTDAMPADKPTRPDQFYAPPFTQFIRLNDDAWRSVQLALSIHFSAEAWASFADARCGMFCTRCTPFPPTHVSLDHFVWWFNAEFTQLVPAAAKLAQAFAIQPFSFAFLVPHAPSNIRHGDLPRVADYLRTTGASPRLTFAKDDTIFEQMPTTFQGGQLASHAPKFVPCGPLPFDVHIWAFIL